MHCQSRANILASWFSSSVVAMAQFDSKTFVGRQLDACWWGSVKVEEM